MGKKSDLTCSFDPVKGEAFIYKGKAKELLVESRDLKTSEGGLLDKAFGVKPGQDYFGTAMLPNGDISLGAQAKFHVFQMNAKEMGCAVEVMGIEAAPAPRVAAPAASAPAFAPAVPQR